MFLALAVAGTAAIALFTPLLDEAATVSVLGGAAGAVVSVMNRMTSGSLKVRPEAGKKTIRALGFMRPVIGAVFGAVVYLFLDGGIVQVLSPPDGGREPGLLRRARLRLRLQRALRPGRHRAGFPRAREEASAAEARRNLTRSISQPLKNSFQRRPNRCSVTHQTMDFRILGPLEVRNDLGPSTCRAGSRAPCSRSCCCIRTSR